MKGSEIRNALIYLIISLFLAAAGAVYEHFSFGVYSNYMIYAFAIPLIGGTLPHMLTGLRNQRRAAAADGLGEGGPEESDAEIIPVNPASGRTHDSERFWQAAEALVKSWLYSAALATLTVGSIMKGVLDICGRPNGLTIGYPIAAALLLAAAVTAAVRAVGTSPGDPAEKEVCVPDDPEEVYLQNS